MLKYMIRRLSAVICISYPETSGYVIWFVTCLHEGDLERVLIISHYFHAASGHTRRILCDRDLGMQFNVIKLYSSDTPR